MNKINKKSFIFCIKIIFNNNLVITKLFHKYIFEITIKNVKHNSLEFKKYPNYKVIEIFFNNCFFSLCRLNFVSILESLIFAYFIYFIYIDHSNLILLQLQCSM